MAAEEVEHVRIRVLSLIDKAFGSLKYDGGMRIYDAELLDSGGHETKLIKARKNDSYIKWQDIPDEIISVHSAVLSFFDEQSYLFHIPAYMRFALRNYETSDSMAIDYTIYSFALSNKQSQRDREIKRFAVFDPAQCKTIYRFLKFMTEEADDQVDSEAAKNALVAYWNRYDEEDT